MKWSRCYFCFRFFFLLVFLPASRRRVFIGPRSLSRAPSASVIGAADGSVEHCLVDPRAELQAATERNTQEAHEEQEEAEELRLGCGSLYGWCGGQRNL